MDLIHRFTVPAPIEDAWAAFNDLERIAPCFPGAALTSYDGEEFAGLVKVKLGPISLQYTGTGRFVERDEEAHRAVIEAKGKDKRGNGTAAATVTAQLAGAADGATDVEVTTALNITGKPAQFGRGVMQDVSDKLLGQFATCLETKLGPDVVEVEATAAGVEPVAAGVEPAVAGVEPAAGWARAAQPEPELDSESQPDSESEPEALATVLPPDPAPAAEPAAEPASADPVPRKMAARDTGGEAALDLGATVLPILVRRYAPYAVGGVVGLALLWRLFRRLH